MINKLENIAVNTFSVLCSLGNERDSIKGNIPQLIFPNDQQPKKSNKIRISEQEGKLIFIQNIKSIDLFYSIETPTLRKYNFTSKFGNARAGSLDLCIFEKENDFLKRKVNIEFKAHNMKEYHQDFHKLLAEPGDSMFFHILESVNNGTLRGDNGRKGVFPKYKEAFDKMKNKSQKSGEWFFYIVVLSLNPKILMSLVIDNNNFNSKHDLFNFEYSIERKRVKILNKYNWNILYS